MLMSLDIKQTTFGWGINQLNTCFMILSMDMQKELLSNITTSVINEFGTLLYPNSPTLVAQEWDNNSPTLNAFISLQDNEVAMFAPNSTTRDIDNEEFNTISIIIECRDIRLVERDFNTINEVIDFLESFLFS